MPKEYFEQRKIPYVCFHYRMGETEYLDDLGESMSFETFYQKMDAGVTSVTSQVNVEEYIEFWEPFLIQGNDILHVSLSSGISGAFNSANIAKIELSEKYPEQRIEVIDSLGASSGYGMLVDAMADMRDSGSSFQEICEWAKIHKLEIHHWFFSTDLTSYKRGGRISGTEAFLGNVLGICPLLNVDEQGKLIPRQKVRTKRKVIEEMVDRMEQNAKDGNNYAGKCFISHSACLEDAKKVEKRIEEKFPNLKGKVLMNSIGTVIGSHTGSGTVALFFFGNERKIVE